jgi:hypothetical protein
LRCREADAADCLIEVLVEMIGDRQDERDRVVLTCRAHGSMLRGTR